MFFGRGKVASGVAEVGCLFPRFRGSIWLWRELSLQFKILKYWHVWRSDWKNVHQTKARSRFHIKIKKTGMFGAGRKSPLLMHKFWSIWRGSPAMRVCIGTAACSIAWVIMPGRCYARLQLKVAKRIVAASRWESLGCRSYSRDSWEAAQTSFLHSFSLSFSHSVIHSFVHSFLPSTSISFLLPIVISDFRNFCPGACRALSGSCGGDICNAI